MKLITLNTWGGRVNKDLLSFLENKRETIDIFCFQEVYNKAIPRMHPEQGGLTPNLNLFENMERSSVELPNYSQNIEC